MARKTTKQKAPDDDLRHRRLEIVLLDGPLAGTYYANNLQAYFCLPHVSRAEFLSYSDQAFHAEVWLYYKNTGSRTSKHKRAGHEYRFVSYEREPQPATISQPWNCAIAAAKNAWGRKEFELHADPY